MELYKKLLIIISAASVVMCACSSPAQADKMADLRDKATAAYDSVKENDGKEADVSGNDSGKDAAAKYDGTWYEQSEDGGILTIADGVMSYKGVYDDKSAFTPEKTEDGYKLVADENDFWFYEIQYIADDDRIVTYTWPEDDGDGGYKPATFMRTEYVEGDESTIKYLEGEWEIMDGSGHIQEPGEERDILHFGNSRYHGASYSKNGNIARFTYELNDRYKIESFPMYNFVTLNGRSTNEDLDWAEVSAVQYFQVFLSNDHGHDYMMLKECGDARTGFATGGLSYDRGVVGTWFFSRYVPPYVGEDYVSDDVMPSTVGMEEELRVRSDFFYAVKWTEFGNGCTLQKVELVPVKIKDYDGSTVDRLCYVLPEGEYAYSTVYYEYKGGEKYCHDGYFDPKLVYVHTDKKGQITEMTYFEPDGNGYYYTDAKDLVLVPEEEGPVG